MTQDPRSRVHPAGAVSRRKNQQEPSIESPSSRVLQHGIKDILRTLAAHGAGTASAELAFDLVLHEIVDEVREATQATGAAIAWMRNGEMVCRATTGESAPNLGVRLDIRSGLAGACADTGEIQNCQDTETDSRVNAETCRELGIRSTLFAPISIARETLGILQLYSGKPSAFGESEIRMVEPFIHRSLDTWTEAQAGDESSSADQTESRLADHDISDERFEHVRDTEDESAFTGFHEQRKITKELTNSILLIAVLAVAIILGLTLGWRWGREQVLGTSGSRSVPNTAMVVATASGLSSQSATGPGSAAQDKSIGSGPSANRAVSSSTANDLVISQDGRVIYRSIDRSSNGGAYHPPTGQGTPLLRRVDPDYPPAALAQHVEGPVVLDVKVLPSGNVSGVVVRSGDPLLTEAAVEAVRQWRFQSTEGASAVERQTQVTIRFSLSTKE